MGLTQITTGGVDDNINIDSNTLKVDGTNNRVGIGTAAPANKLHVSDTSGSAQIRITGSSGSSNIYADSNIYFQPNGSTAVTLASSGNVGVGVSSPLRSLHIAGAGDTGLMLQTTNAVDNNEIWEIQVGANASNHADLIFRSRTNAGTGGSEAMRIDRSGRLLVGTTTEGAVSGDNLTIAASANCGMTIRSGINNFGSIYFSDATSGGGEYDGYIAYSQPNRFMQFATGQAERMRIDSSGRLLVGTSSSASGSVSHYARLQVQGHYQGSADEARISFQRGESSASMSNGDKIALISFADKDGGDYARIEAYADSTPGSSDYPGRLAFSTTADGASSPTERMRIGNGGMASLFASSGWESQILFNQNGAGTARSFIIGRHSATACSSASGTIGTISFRVYTNGNVTNTNNSYGAISDIKLKENIVDASSQWNDLKAIQVRNYNFIEGQTHTQIGVVAQEVETVSPGLVSESPDRDEEGTDLGTVTKSVNYSVLYMKAVKALQEAMERIETLETKVAALEAG